MNKFKSKRKKPSGKYPALYYQEDVDRIRIIYPCGKAEWRDGSFVYWLERGVDLYEFPCWTQVDANFHDQIKAMRSYDVVRRWRPAIFLGEIK